MEKVDNMQEQMDNFTKEVLTVIKNQMETLNKKKKNSKNTPCSTAELTQTKKE